jgi:hypothetical protein
LSRYKGGFKVKKTHVEMYADLFKIKSLGIGFGGDRDQDASVCVSPNPIALLVYYPKWSIWY